MIMSSFQHKSYNIEISSRNRMNNALDNISRADIAKERVREPKDTSIETSQMGNNEERMEDERISRKNQ
jgi:hypothetical protein